MSNFSKFREHQVLGQTLPKKLAWKKFWKNKYQNRKQRIAMLPCTKFHEY